MRKPLVLAGMVLLMVGSALAQDDFPRVETAPAFMYIRTVPNKNLPSLNCAGGGGTFAVNLTSVFGLAADLGGCRIFSNAYGLGNTVKGNEFTFLFGPRITFRNRSPFRPFFEVNFGGARISLTCRSSATNCVNATAGATLSRTAFAMTAGGGFDIRLSKKFALRLVQAEYLYTRFGNDCPLTVCTNSNHQNSFRLKSGIVIGWGEHEAVAPAASCSLRPAQVMAGEAITATATGSNFNPKHTLSYTWAATGGKVTGKDNTASIDTNGVAGGNYTVTAHITDAKMKKGGEASCSDSFTVKVPPKNPPTMSCSASPTSVQAGTSSTTTCTCTSPDNVPVTVAGWNASGGSISGSGNAATLNTSGAAPGAITVSATCTDSRGLTASSSSTVTVEAPPPVRELEVRLALHSIYFPTAQPTAQKPDGGLLVSQQQTLTALASDFLKYLQSKPDAHLTLEGHADVRGSVPYNQALSQRRVERTKSFLIEQGVPAANIDTKALGNQHNLTADEVKSLVETNPELTPEERQRILRNMKTIIWANNRRVDITLSTTGQESVRHFPFNAADSLSLIGGREAAEKKTAPPAKKGTKKK